MTMTIWQGAITIVTVVLGTMCTRFLPFLVFPESSSRRASSSISARSCLCDAMTGHWWYTHCATPRF